MLNYSCWQGQVKQKCEWIQKILQPIKQAIIGAKFEFRWIVSSFLDYFTDDLMLFTHLENELLPICDACRGYKFKIDFPSDYSAATNFFSKILQSGTIAGSSNVSFDLKLGKYYKYTC